MLDFQNFNKPKISRNELTLDQKKTEIILYHHEYPKLTQMNLFIYFTDKFGKHVALQTISDILVKRCKFFFASYITPGESVIYDRQAVFNFG